LADLAEFQKSITSTTPCSIKEGSWGKEEEGTGKAIGKKRKRGRNLR
jgi:hypothetical protein